MSYSASNIIFGAENPYLTRGTGYYNFGHKYIDTIQAKADQMASEQQMRELTLSQMKEDREAQRRAEQRALDLSKQYLGQWNQHLSKTKGLINSAVSNIDKTVKSLGDIQPYLSKLDTVADDIMGEYQTYKEKYSGVEGEAIQAQREGLSTLRGLSKADYEGAAGRAMADATSQANIAKEATARDLARLGIDPTSGKGQAAMRRISDNAVLAKVMGANTARRGEKERVTNVALPMTQLAGNVAGNVQAGKQNLLKMGTGAMQTAVGTRSDLARLKGDLAGQKANLATVYNQAVTQPIGEVAHYYQGAGLGAEPKQRGWINFTK